MSTNYHNSQTSRKIDCVSILAGGGGTRLWPASTEQRPKQFMKIASDKSLLLQTLERSWQLEPELGVFVVCNQNYDKEILAEIALLPKSLAPKTYVLPEPHMRNTATALFYVNQLIEQLAGPQAVNLVQTSDHLIGEPDIFHQSIEQAVELARNQHIVVFGLKPLYPATGYGYIECGKALGSLGGLDDDLDNLNSKTPGFQVLRFTEKPNLTTAKQFLASGNFYWNSGMFCYTVGLFRQELTALTNSIPAALQAASSSLVPQIEKLDTVLLLQPSPELATAYSNCDNISIDYAVMEKTTKLALLPANFDWNDIGSWDVLATLEDNTQPLVEVGSTNGNFVRSTMPVALCNVSDLIVVEENGVLLICQKGSSELVKAARNQLDLLQKKL